MDAPSASAVAVDRLVKHYKTGTAVDGISFSLAPGSVTGLLGGNGAGKTTTIAIIMGMVTPTTGSVHVLGAEMPKERYRVLHRMNFESPYVDLPMRITVRQNLSVFAHLYGVPDIDARIRELASDRELTDLLDRPAHYGRVDVLVNNAGMSPLYEHVADVTEALWDKVIGVNLKGPFRLTAVLGKRMVEQGSGSIIFVSSTGSLHPTGGVIPYAAAKAAVNAMTVGFAHHFGPRVRVNCIIPGPFLTDISKAWDMPAFEKRAQTGIAMRHGGQPDEIVGAALYLASDSASFTTGAWIRVDGGSP